MRAVHDTARIIQGDISETNVMFRVTDDGKVEGVLNDWDNNRPAHTEVNTQERLQIVVSLKPSSYHFHLLTRLQGTWEFMAIELHDNSNGHAQSSLRYDLEAIVLWVFLYTAFKHLSYTPKYQWHREMFCECTSEGVAHKRNFLQGLGDLPIFSRAPDLTLLVRRIFNHYSAYYTALDLCEDGIDAKDDVARARACVSDVQLFVELFEHALEGAAWPAHDRMTDPYSVSDMDLEYSY